MNVMRLKTIIELLTLSTSLYTISKDEELMKKLENFAFTGKTNIDKLIKGYSKNEYDEYDDEFIENENTNEEHQLIHQILEKAKVAKDELEVKMEEIAAKLYENLHIAHTDEIKELKEDINKLKNELALTEARVVHLEGK